MLFLSLYSSSPSILECGNLLGSSFSVVLMVFVFNTLIFAFLVRGYSRSYDGFDDFDWSLPSILSVDVVEDRCNDIDSSDDDSEDDYSYPSSDGYNEDDDDDGADEEVGWTDEEQDDDDDNGTDEEVGWTDEEQDDDDDLNKRIEEFIAKVNKGWREEWLRENLHNNRFMV